ncbi:rhodopsin, GQ-coupled isoform X2 [Pieris napi]|uniref:rhodopsin, GQ-coupled isoform X2 n=1 Tax=Pieris napi TaxID=78633 RepID=UPI001FBB7358|nr:rhodopsin, GQ-coupled isoform X2 [Pieris napi]
MSDLPSDNLTQYDTFENQTDFDEAATQFVNNLYLYYTPILTILGSIGNLLSVYVFFISKLRLQSTSQYLSALAVSDTVFLLQLLAPWLSAMRVTSIFFTGGFCQVFVYLSYVSCCLSAWLVMAFTIERFVAVLYPLHRNAWCTVRRARNVIVLLTAGAAMVNLPVLRFAIPSRNDCNIDKRYLVYAARFNLVDTMLSFTVPLSMIVLMNVWIIVGVYRIEKTRQQMMRSQSAGQQRMRPTGVLASPGSQQHVTRMLLIVSSVFVFFNLPAYVFRMIAYAYNLGSAHLVGRWSALQQLAVMFFHSNFGINFMLYCLTGQNFRRAVRQSIPCLRQKPRRQDAVRRATRPARTSSISSLSAASYVSTCTEAITNFPSTSTPSSRSQRSEAYIRKWKFDNSRTQRHSPNYSQNPHSIKQRDNIEMHNIKAIATDM